MIDSAKFTSKAGFLLTFVAMLSLLVFADEGPELPPSLKLTSYDNVINNGMHLVEFYSPYCVHCKHFEPVWKDVFNNFNYRELGIEMHQVNCVENGDLCDREAIKFYPSIRMIGSKDADHSGVVLDTFPSNLEKTAENLMEFMRNVAYRYGNMDELHIPSNSNLIENMELSSILSGNYDSPIFLSFWPNSEDVIKRALVDEPGIDFGDCYKCDSFKNMWKIISNHLEIPVGHVSCVSNMEACNYLNYQLDSSILFSPQIAMVLPRNSDNFIRYDTILPNDDINYHETYKWAVRLLQNYEFQDMDVISLSKKMNLVNKIMPDIIHDAELPGQDGKVSFVYYYGNDLHENSILTKEDLSIVPYLLDSVMRLPNVYLYKSNDTHYLKLIERQQKNLVRYIHYNESEPEKPFNKEYFEFITATSKPTLLAFKEDSLIPTVMQNTGPNEIRKIEKVKQFIKDNSMPFISELTPESFNKIFVQLQNRNIDKVVVAFFDTNDRESTNSGLKDLSIAAHDYYYYWSKQKYNNHVEKRELKQEKVDNDEIAITEEIIKYDSSGQTLFTYLDISKYKHLIDENGWNIHGRENFERGDAIIIERTGKFYYETDIFGETLKNKPWILRNTLLSFINGNDIGVTPPRRNLINSPYGEFFRPMDYIHRHGIKGYAFVVILFLAVGWFIRKRRPFQFILQKIHIIRYNYGGNGYKGYISLLTGAGNSNAAVLESGNGGNKSSVKLGILGNIPDDLKMEDNKND